jgi:hypothetical protein
MKHCLKKPKPVPIFLKLIFNQLKKMNDETYFVIENAQMKTRKKIRVREGLMKTK